MRTILITNPSFTPGAAGAGTLNFSSVSGFKITGLVAVINLTRNAVIYAEGKAPFGITGWNNSTKVLTLTPDTSTHSSSDLLQCIVYNTPDNLSLHHNSNLAATLNKTVVKSSAGILRSIYFQPIEDGGAIYSLYCKIYDKSSAPDPSVDTPMMIVGCYTVYGSQPFKLPEEGIPFVNGLSYLTSINAIDTDTTAIIAHSGILDLIYK